jgi:hypothetical protein
MRQPSVSIRSSEKVKVTISIAILKIKALRNGRMHTTKRLSSFRSWPFFSTLSFIE